MHGKIYALDDGAVPNHSGSLINPRAREHRVEARVRLQGTRSRKPRPKAQEEDSQNRRCRGDGGRRGRLGSGWDWETELNGLGPESAKEGEVGSV